MTTPFVVPKITEVDWQPHGHGMGGFHAVVPFPNGYAASCVKGGPFYTRDGTYEIAVLRNDELDYTTPVTDDVCGYLSENDANDILTAIAALPKPQGPPSTE